MIKKPIHNGYSLLGNHGSDCVLLPLVDNLYIAFPITLSTLSANYRTFFSLELLLLQSSPVVEISSLLNFIRISFVNFCLRNLCSIV